MPYKLSGTSVYVKRGAKWKLLKKHPNRRRALAHFRALKINVKDV